MIGEIIEKNLLTYNEAINIFTNIAEGSYSEAQIAAILTTLRLKGETSEIVRAAIDVFNNYKIKVDLGENIIDTCGTGGDNKSSINISSAVALTLSAMNKKVVKHGNKAQTGKIGSADIFESLGVPVNLDPENVKKYFKRHNFVFLFAPSYHPAFKYVGPIRKQLGFPTIFNYLGPFLNPANPDYQIVGINKLEKINILKDACMKRNYKKLIIYSSTDGYDEISTKNTTIGVEIENNSVNSIEIKPSDFFEPFDMPYVTTKEEGIKKFLEGISGKDENLSSLIALNTALGLYALGEVSSLKDGYTEAKKVILKGDVIKKLESLKN